MCGIEISGQFVGAAGVSVVSGGQSLRATSSSWSRAHAAGPWGIGSGPRQRTEAEFKVAWLIWGNHHGRSELWSWGLFHSREMLDHGRRLAGWFEPCLRAGIFPCQRSEG